MPQQCIGVVLPAGASCSCDGCGSPASNSAVRHHLHEHQHREDQGYASQSIGTQKADEIGLCHTNGCLHHEHEDRRDRETQNCRDDGAGEKASAITGWRIAYRSAHGIPRIFVRTLLEGNGNLCQYLDVKYNLNMYDRAAHMRLALRGPIGG